MAPTGAFDFTDVVARKPSRLSVEGPLPPAPILLTSHPNDVTLVKGELILVGLQEVETRFHQQLLPAVL